MIHVKVDLVPFGEEDGRRQISEIYIGNIGQEMAGKCRYAVYLEDPRGKIPRPKPDTKVYHSRQEGVEILIGIALKSLKRKKKIPK